MVSLIRSLQDDDPEAELTHAAIELASESIVVCGTIPLPVVVSRAVPVLVVTSVLTFAKAAIQAVAAGGAGEVRAQRLGAVHVGLERIH
jgi:hypothetical protein